MICKKCAHESYCDMAQFGEHKPPITACSKFKEKQQTNADRIRSMSDEELAERFYLFLCVHVLDDKIKCKDDGCKKCWMKWLREEYKNES